ncbi:MAG: hypothetical protein GY718_06390 [Lentisphaerae bacterium]|nr:hypothetical protein [Lentisphaerota bacterium]
MNNYIKLINNFLNKNQLYINLFIYCFCILSILFSIYIFSIGFNNPILDRHSFRQTQTALSAYWMLKNGHYLFYQTPVYGIPWTIPFELPTYQWLVVIIYKISHLPLDVCGRLISIIFFYLTFWPIYKLLKALKLEFNLFLILVILTCFSPIYLFWSRTFMIESVSLFLSFCYLVNVQLFLSKRKLLFLIVGVIFGSLAILTKVTTFVPISIFSAWLIIFDWHKNFGFNLRKKIIIKYAITILFALVPILILLIWAKYSDQLKMESISGLGEELTSSSLFYWNFGTIGQRISSKLWYYTVFSRSIQLTVNKYCFLLYYIPLFFCLLKSKYFKFALISFISFLASFLIFPNLFIIHDYYLYENSIYLLLFCSIILFYLLKRKHNILFFIVIILTIFLQVKTYFNNNGITYASASQNLEAANDFSIGKFINNNINPNGKILVYGNDWSSTICYYSKRKSLTDPLGGNYVDRLKNIHKILGINIDAVVIKDYFDEHNTLITHIVRKKEFINLIKKITVDFKEVQIGSSLILYKPNNVVQDRNKLSDKNILLNFSYENNNFYFKSFKKNALEPF